MKRLIAAFKNPVKRPRSLIWVGVVLIGFMAFYASANVLTSTNWFCNEVCHVVHYDNARAYAASSHDNVSCMSCHYHTDLNQIQLALDRAAKLFDIPPTIAQTFHKPVNEYSHVALSMHDEQCVQCHSLETRVVSPTKGLIINHEIHAEEHIPCTACHNRVAHREDKIEIMLEGNRPKQDFLTMTACYRCHSLSDESPSEYKAPGACPTCHTPTFSLVPASHTETGWVTIRGTGRLHADAAIAETSETVEAVAAWAEVEDEFKNRKQKFLVKLAGIKEELIVDLPPERTINECLTCHAVTFCDACHGTRIPHEAEFVETHGKEHSAAKDAKSCAMCHNKTGKTAMDAFTCTICHHPTFDPNKGRWVEQHPKYATDEVKSIVEECLNCHDPLYCEQCHVSGAPRLPY